MTLLSKYCTPIIYITPSPALQEWQYSLFGNFCEYEKKLNTLQKTKYIGHFLMEKSLRDSLVDFNLTYLLAITRVNCALT